MSDEFEPETLVVANVKKIKSEKGYPLGFAFAIDFMIEYGMVFKGEWWENDMQDLPFVYKKADDAFRLMKEIKKGPIEEEEEVNCIILVVAYYTKEEEHALKTLDNKDEKEEVEEILKAAFPE